jgi:Zn-dependent protease
VTCHTAWAAFVFATLLLGSLLAHEAAHTAAAIACGVRVKAIGLSAAGAYTIRSHSADRTIELLTALSGPLANLLLWVAFSGMPGVLANLLATCNLILGLSNLVPIRPTDGWRICRLLFGEPRSA